MNKKGFTLIELMAVIAILAIILTITFSTISNVLEDSRENTYKTQIASIENGAKRFVSDNIQTINENGNYIFSKENENIILIAELKESGYLVNKNIEDPKTGKTMNGCVVVSYADTYKQFQYKYVNYECENINSLTPKIIFTKQNGTNKYLMNIDYPEKGKITRPVSYIYKIGSSEDYITDSDVTNVEVNANEKVIAEIKTDDSEAEIVRSITEVSGN